MDIRPNWKKFTKAGGRGVYEKRASLSPRGVFTLNQPTFEEMGQPDAVELLFDDGQRLIGLSPVAKDAPYAYMVRKQKTNKSYLIGARPFCHHFRLNIEQTIRFNDIKVIDGVLVLDMNNTVPVEAKKPKAEEKGLRMGGILVSD